MGNQCCDSRTKEPMNDMSEVILTNQGKGQFPNRDLGAKVDDIMGQSEVNRATSNHTNAVSQTVMEQKITENAIKRIDSKYRSNGIDNNVYKSQLGQITFADGSIYTGNSLDNKPHGNGKRIYPDGSVYQGEWKNGQKNGAGTLKSEGCKIIGTWIDDMLEGPVEQIHEDGMHFKGEYRQGKRSGLGRLDLKNKEFYEGWFRNGQFQGQGKYVWLGEQYEGEWHQSKMHGLGEYRWADGRRYIGHYKNGLRQGYGELLDLEGGVIRANWYMSKPTGLIVYIDKDGLAQESHIMPALNDDV